MTITIIMTMMYNNSNIIQRIKITYDNSNDNADNNYKNDI